MKIGNITFPERPLFLAPMEDVTDIGFRMLCKRFGAQMVYTEFVSAEALVRSVKSTVKKLTVCDEERPVGIQIYGRSVADMVEAARIVEAEAHPDVIDINFGCPVKKVAGKGAGAGMLQNVPLLLDITENVAKAVSTPVTVKTRLGWNADDLKATVNENRFLFPLAEYHEPSPQEYEMSFIEQLSLRLRDAGAQAITLHGRTRAQMYTGDADWTLIGKVKQRLSGQSICLEGSDACSSLPCKEQHTTLPPLFGEGRGGAGSIPIIGNGDIKSLQQADEAFDKYGVDAVMVGRATFGCPWFFSHEELTLDQKIDILLEQLHINVERLDEYRGILHTRRHLAATPIFKGIPDFRQTRIAMLRAETVDELTSVIQQAKELVLRQTEETAM